MSAKEKKVWRVEVTRRVFVDIFVSFDWGSASYPQDFRCD